MELPKEKKVRYWEHTSSPKYKAKLIVRGFNQVQGIDFDKIFSLVVKISSIHVDLSIVVNMDL